MGMLLVAWLDIRSRPLRTIVATGGMIVAVLALVVVDAATGLSQRANDEYIQSTWGRTATVRITSASGTTAPSPAEMDDAATRLITTLEHNGIGLVSPVDSVGMTMIHGSARQQVYPRWVSTDFPDISYVDMVAGAFPVQTAMSEVPHAIVSVGLAMEMGFAPGQAVGQVVQYTPSHGEQPDLRTSPLAPLVIDGVASRIGPDSDRAEMLIVSDVRYPSFAPDGAASWLVRVNERDVGFAMALAGSVMIRSDRSAAFEANRVDQGVSLAPVLEQQATTARIVSVLALAIGAFGIVGTGLAGVRERAREYGLRRALGASTRQVFLSAIIQTVLEGLLAAAIAITAAAIVVGLFARQLVIDRLPLPSSSIPPVDSAIRGVLAAVGVALVAGFFPAIRAARTSVVQALRD